MFALVSSGWLMNTLALSDSTSFFFMFFLFFFWELPAIDLDWLPTAVELPR